jgi:predicted lipoprotein
METINKTVVENPDSIEMGSAAKGIKIKVYGDFSKLEEFKEKIDNARASKDYAIQILG